jgi:hypothetical protein
LWIINQDVIGIHFSIVFNVSCQFLRAENVIVICGPKFLTATDHSKPSPLPLHHKLYEQKVTWFVPVKMYHWVIIKLKLSVQHNFLRSFGFAFTVLIRVTFAECPYCLRIQSIPSVLDAIQNYTQPVVQAATNCELLYLPSEWAVL